MNRVLFLFALLTAVSVRADEKAPISFQAADVPWKDAPPSMPVGTKIAVLEGNPKESGIFTIRLQVQPGFKLPPHWHPQDERVTVISGSVLVGFGDAFEATKGRKIEAGSYYVNPARTHHFVWSETGAVLQITGMGPWEVHPVEKAR